MTRALVASFGMILANILGCSPTSTGLVVRGEAMSGEGQCQALDLDSVTAIDTHRRELVVKGAVLGWDPRPEKMESADRRCPGDAYASKDSPAITARST